MAGSHTGSRGSSARNGMRLWEPIRVNQSKIDSGRTRGEMPALCRRFAAPSFLLWRYCHIVGTEGKLLWLQGVVLLLQRRIRLARRSMPVLSEQVSSRA